jgi:hypothetical protein
LAAASTVPSRGGIDVSIDSFNWPDREPSQPVYLWVEAELSEPIECEDGGIYSISVSSNEGFWSYSYLGDTHPAWWFDAPTDYSPPQQPVDIRYTATAAGFNCGWGFVDGDDYVDVPPATDAPVGFAFVSQGACNDCCSGVPNNCTSGAIQIIWELRFTWGPKANHEVREFISLDFNDCTTEDQLGEVIEDTDSQGRLLDRIYKCLGGQSTEDCCGGNTDCASLYTQQLRVGGQTFRTNFIDKYCTQIQVSCGSGCL